MKSKKNNKELADLVLLTTVPTLLYFYLYPNESLTIFLVEIGAKINAIPRLINILAVACGVLVLIQHFSNKTKNPLEKPSKISVQKAILIEKKANKFNSISNILAILSTLILPIFLIFKGRFQFLAQELASKIEDIGISIAIIFFIIAKITKNKVKKENKKNDYPSKGTKNTTSFTPNILQTALFTRFLVFTQLVNMITSGYSVLPTLSYLASLALLFLAVRIESI